MFLQFVRSGVEQVMSGILNSSKLPPPYSTQLKVMYPRCSMRGLVTTQMNLPLTLRASMCQPTLN